MRLVITESAQQDIDDVYNYSVQYWGEVRARETLAEINQAMCDMTDSLSLSKKVIAYKPLLKNTSTTLCYFVANQGRYDLGFTNYA